MTAGAPGLPKLKYLTRLRGAGLSTSEYTVLVTLLTYARKDLTNARPGWTRMTTDTGLSRTTVKRVAGDLVDKGFLVLSTQGGNLVGHGMANVYTLTLPPDSSSSGPLVDPYGGEEGGRPQTPKGSADDEEGVHDGAGRGPLMDPHQGSTSSGPNVIIPHAWHAGESPSPHQGKRARSRTLTAHDDDDEYEAARQKLNERPPEVWDSMIVWAHETMPGSTMRERIVAAARHLDEAS